jgi:hypothetical protein
VAPWLGTAYLQLAHQRGFDRAAGMAMNLVPYRNPQEIVQAWLQGKVALAPLTTVEVVEAAIGQVRLHEAVKATQAIRLVEENCHFERLFARLLLP